MLTACSIESEQKEVPVLTTSNVPVLGNSGQISDETVNPTTSLNEINTLSYMMGSQKETKSVSTNLLRVSYIDVGQADSILIQTPAGKNILIDAGNTSDADTIKKYLNGLKIKKLDAVIFTHPHEDHIGGSAAIIKAYQIGKIYMSRAVTTTKTYENLLSAIKNKGIKATEAKAGSIIDIGDASVELTILAPNSKDYEDLNDFSVVVKLTYNKTSFLFTGDAETVSEKEMLNKKYDLEADVLKIGHHGSRSSTSDAFLKAVSPKYAIVSVGAINDYGHPAEETMNKLKTAKIPVYRTDENGTIVCTSDGENIKFNVKPGSYNYGGGKDVKTSSVATPAGNAPGDTNSTLLVFYTPNGKSYHYQKNCSTLSRSKTILEGKLSEAIKKGKDDPCNKCAGGN